MERQGALPGSAMTNPMTNDPAPPYAESTTFERGLAATAARDQIKPHRFIQWEIRPDHVASPAAEAGLNARTVQGESTDSPASRASAAKSPIRSTTACTTSSRIDVANRNTH